MIIEQSIIKSFSCYHSHLLVWPVGCNCTYQRRWYQDLVQKHVYVHPSVPMAAVSHPSTALSPPVFFHPCLHSIPEMTSYYILSGKLNSTYSVTHYPLRRPSDVWWLSEKKLTENYRTHKMKWNSHVTLLARLQVTLAMLWCFRNCYIITRADDVKHLAVSVCLFSW